jgi:hypothetical protein
MNREGRLSAALPCPVPEIPARDLASATAYYEQKLGFTVDWGGEELGLAGISTGSRRLFLADGDYREGYGNVGPVLTWLNLESKEAVDALFEGWRGAHRF